MRKDVASWYRQCTGCARGRGPPNKPHGRLKKVVVGEPLDIVAIDILSGLPATPEGYKYILVITDYFTKWSEAYALRDAEAPTCMRTLYNSFFSRFGLRRQLHSDQGKNFESKLFHELCALAGVKKSKTTPFHPQSDGQTERMNRTLLQMLRATCQDNPESWPQKLDTLMAAYRMTQHRVTGVTPNLAMLGREVLLPATLIAKPSEEPQSVSVPFVRDLRDCIRGAHARVRQATQATAKTQKQYYDKSVREQKFQTGQLVWLYWPNPPVRQKYRKLQQVWTGPWRILEFRSDVVVTIQHTLKRTKQTVHINRLTPCKSPEPQNLTTFDTPPEEPLAASTEIPAESEHQTRQLSHSPTPTTSTSTVSHPSAVERPRRKRRLPVTLEPYVL